MGIKWTAAQHAKYKATMAARRNTRHFVDRDSRTKELSLEAKLDSYWRKLPLKKKKDIVLQNMVARVRLV